MAKKKYSIPKTLFIVFLAIVAIANVVYYITSYFTRPPHILYPEFGIHIPPNYAIHGIDVSRYQKTINWSDVKEMNIKNIKIGFAYIKATEGVDRIDPEFQRNWLHAGEQNIPKGAYHYFIAGKSGKAQADNFIEIVKLQKGDLPPVLDAEDARGEPANEIHQQIEDWLKKIEEEYHVKPIIYSNINFYNIYLKDKFTAYPFWIAHYQQPGKPRIENWTFWQHSERGHVNGIKPTVDFNVFSGDSTAFNDLLIK